MSNWLCSRLANLKMQELFRIKLIMIYSSLPQACRSMYAFLKTLHLKYFIFERKMSLIDLILKWKTTQHKNSVHTCCDFLIGSGLKSFNIFPYPLFVSGSIQWIRWPKYETMRSFGKMSSSTKTSILLLEYFSHYGKYIAKQ